MTCWALCVVRRSPPNKKSIKMSKDIETVTTHSLRLQYFAVIIGDLNVQFYYWYASHRWHRKGGGFTQSNNKFSFLHCSKYYQFLSWMCHWMALTGSTATGSSRITTWIGRNHAVREIMDWIVFLDWCYNWQLRVWCCVKLCRTKEHTLHAGHSECGNWLFVFRRKCVCSQCQWKMLLTVKGDIRTIVHCEKSAYYGFHKCSQRKSIFGQSSLVREPIRGE